MQKMENRMSDKMNRKILKLIFPITAVCVGSYLGFSQTCATTCQASADAQVQGVHSGNNMCFLSVCLSNGQLVQAQCLKEKCKACHGYPAGEAYNCPAQSAACGANINVICSNAGGC
jgi:hypothetical protein